MSDMMCNICGEEPKEDGYNICMWCSSEKFICSTCGNNETHDDEGDCIECLKRLEADRAIDDFLDRQEYSDSIYIRNEEFGGIYL